MKKTQEGDKLQMKKYVEQQHISIHASSMSLIRHWNLTMIDMIKRSLIENTNDVRRHFRIAR